MKILMLGCGNIGANVAINLARTITSVPITVADINFALANQVAQLGGSSITGTKVDIFNRSELGKLMEAHDIVFNACGPFYKTAIPIIECAIDVGVNYVDICDDEDITKKLFLDPVLDERARRKGIVILTGCGNGPGFGNVLAKHAADQLEKTSTIRFSTALPYAPKYFSPSITDHIFHMLSGTVTQYIGGKHVEVSAYEGTRNVEFLPPFGTYPVSYSGHPEAITLPRYVKDVDEVTVGLGFYPQPVNDFMKALLSLGINSRQRLDDLEVSPIQFFSSFLKRKVEEGKPNLLNSTPVVPNGCVNQIEVTGFRDGDPVRIIYEDHMFFYDTDKSTDQNEIGVTKDPTGVCARIVLEGLIKGSIQKTGVWSPEGCLNTSEYISRVSAEVNKTLYCREDIVRKGAITSFRSIPNQSLA